MNFLLKNVHQQQMIVHYQDSASSLSAINFNDDDILTMIRSLNSNKAHGHDNISELDCQY